MPIAAIIDEKIFCCHGGLSPDLSGMEQIRRIMRPTDVPDTGLLCDLLWSDPDKDVLVNNFFFHTISIILNIYLNWVWVFISIFLLYRVGVKMTEV